MPLVFEKSLLIKNNTSGIYQIVNRVNGHRYFGSSVDLKKRFNAHRWRLDQNKHCNKHLQNAWNKYGSENFFFQVLEFIELEYLISREQDYLDLVPAYNICPVAGKTKLGTKLSLETIEKIKNSNIGQVRSEKTRSNMSKASRGKPKFRSVVHRNNLTKALTGLKRSVEACSNIRSAHSFQRKPIYGIHVITKEKIIFESLNDARRAGFDQGSICKVLSGKRKLHKQYAWHMEVDSHSTFI